MIFTNPAISFSAKGKMMIGKMPARIIYTTPAKTYTVQPLFFFAFAGGKHIKRKRVRVSVDYFQRLLPISKTEDRQNRAEYLILHYAVVHTDIIKQRGFNKQLR